VPTKVRDADFIGVCAGAMRRGNGPVRTIGKKPQSYLDAYVSSRAPETASTSAIGSRAVWLGHAIPPMDTNRAGPGIFISALSSDDPTPGSSLWDST
jgi:hypothetical protein